MRKLFISTQYTGLLCVLMLAPVGGCKKSEPADQASKPSGGDHQSPIPNHQSQLTAHIHWLGKKRIAAETNAAGFMKIWNLPESAKIEAQTLDKLALALSAEAKGQNPEIETNFPSLQHSNTP